MSSVDEQGRAARLLLVSYNFPPHQTAGALRWQKFAHALAEHGTGLDVLVGSAGMASGRLDEPEGVPPGTRVFAVPRRPSRLTLIEDSMVGMVRRLTAPLAGKVPTDEGKASAPTVSAPGSVAPTALRWLPRSGREVRRAYWVLAQYEEAYRWAQAATAIGRGLLRATQYRGVITSGPPHSAHLAGHWIVRTAELPLVLDLRDPWSLPRRVPESYAHPLHFALARRWEASVVRAADSVIVNTQAVLEAMRDRYPDHPSLVCIPNGFDEVFEPSARRDEFSIVYAGAIYLDRDPRPLFDALALLESDPTVDLSGVHLDLIGRVDSYNGVPTERLVAEAGVSHRVRLHAAVPREELYDRLRGASVLVSLPQDSPWAIPSKVYEYLGFSAWLLAFAAKGSPVARVLTGTHADIVRPGDVAGTASVLKRCIEQFRAGQEPARTVGLERFSRTAQSAKLVSLLAELGICGDGG